MTVSAFYVESVAVVKPPAEKRFLKFSASIVSTVTNAGGGKAFRVTGTTPDVDRAGDVIDPAGCVYDGFMAKGSGPVLYAHGQWDLPVGRAKIHSVAPAGIDFEVEFVPIDVYPFAGQVEWMYENTFLKAWSIGFIPLEWTRNETGGMTVSKWELLELSCVPVPCNAAALSKAAAEGRKVVPVFDEKRGPTREDALRGVDTGKVKAWLAGSEPRFVVIKGAPSMELDPEEIKALAEAAKTGLTLDKDGKLGEDGYKAALEALEKILAACGEKAEEDDADAEDDAEEEADDAEEPAPPKSAPKGVRKTTNAKSHASDDGSEDVDDDAIAELEASLATLEDELAKQEA